MRNNTGFTLIELMIVVAIIAVIAAVAIPSLLRSRMAANEAAAVAACKTFAEAEEIYRRTDYDADGLLEYAQTFRGNFSLVERVAGTFDLCLVDKTFGLAEGPATTAQAKAGFVFTVLTRQGPNFLGGAKNYVIAGNMTMGYGLSAVPASWDGTGRNCYLISSHGTILQKDTGNNTHQLLLNPDTSWATSE